MFAYLTDDEAKWLPEAQREASRLAVRAALAQIDTQGSPRPPARVRARGRCGVVGGVGQAGTSSTCSRLVVPVWSTR